MKPKRDRFSDWQLTRERFHIASAVPPRPLRKEKTIGSILSEMQGEKPENETAPKMLQDRWSSIAGEQLAKHTCPAFIKGSLLIVYADHPGWLTEVRRLPTKQLLVKISSVPKAPFIKEIRFQLDPTIRTYRNK